MRAEDTTLYTYDLSPLLNAPTNTVAARQRAWDELQFLVSLQAQANRDKPRLYFYAVGNNGSIDRFWLHWLQEPHGWLSDLSIKPLNSFDSVVSTFRRCLKGVVVWDDRVPATANVAASIAGVKGLGILRYDPSVDSLYDRLVLKAGGPMLPVVTRLLHTNGSPMFTSHGKIEGTDLPSTGSAKDDAYLWAAEKYLRTGRCDPALLAYYPDAYWITSGSTVPLIQTLLVNEDYYIAHRGFFFDLSPWDDEAPNDDPSQPIGSDAKTLQTILRIAYDRLHSPKSTVPSGGTHQRSNGMIMVGGFPPWDQKYTDLTGGKHGGVATEWRYAEILSCYNAYMDADAASINPMANSSLFCHYPLAKVYPQCNLPTINSLKQSGLIQPNGKVALHHYIAIYVGDYDSSAWLYEKLPQLWTDPIRGQIPIAWAFNPNLDKRFPVGMAYIRQTATPNDTFIAGDSGAGYLNPGYLDPPRRWSDLPSGLEDWVKHCERAYHRWDIHCTGFIIDGNAPPMDSTTLQAYAHFSDGGFIAQKLPSYQGLVDGVPYLRMTADLNGTSQAAAEQIAQNIPGQDPSFQIYRTILWSPSGLKQLYEETARLRPDVRIVDTNTLMLLLKTYLNETR